MNNIQYTKTAFIGLFLIANGLSSYAIANCSAPRTTEKAPESYYRLNNPLKSTSENVAAGKKLFQKTAKPIACKSCHGSKGNGKGPMARMLDPEPRNLTCSNIRRLSDGQLFWIIKNGSPDTSMPAHPNLTNRQYWQLILYIRTLAR